MDYDWEKITPEIAVALLGEPNKKDGKSYRWGNKGSLTLDLEKSAFLILKQTMVAVLLG